MNKNAASGYLMALFTIMMWSLNIVYSKYLAGILTPSEISFYRWFAALFILVPLSWHDIKNCAHELPHYWKIIVLMALSGLGVQNWMIYCAGYTASATNMALISILGPIFIIVLSHQKINLWQICGILLAIAGVVEIILRGSLTNLTDFKFVPGDWYMLGSAFLFAVYALVQKKSPNNVPPTVLLTAGIALSAFIYFFPALPAIIQTPLRTIPPAAWLILLILGIINSAMAYLSWDIVIKKIGTVNAGTMYYTMPIFSIFAAYIFLNEKIYESQLWGAMLIIAGVVSVVFGSHREKHSGR